MLPQKTWTPQATLWLIGWIYISMIVGALALHFGKGMLFPDLVEAESAASNVSANEQSNQQDSPGAPEPSEKLEANDHADTPAWRLTAMMVNMICMHFAALAGIAFLMQKQRLTWGAAFGFNAPGKGKAFMLAVAVVAIAIPVGLTLAVLSAEVMGAFQVKAQSQEAVKLVAESQSPFELLALGFVAIVVAPIVEELLFRGIFYAVIKRHGYPRLALIGTSLLFAASHANIMIFLPLTCLAFALVWLYEKTGNLLAPIAAHSLFNTVNFIMITGGFNFGSSQG